MGVSTCSRSSPTGESPIAEGFVCYWPRTYKPDGTKRGVITAHGAKADYTTFLPPDAASAQGNYADVGPTLAGGLTFGNDASGTAVTNAFNWLTAGPMNCKSDKVVLSGGSMGTLTVLNWAKANPTKVAAILLVDPAVDVVDLHDNNRAASLGITPTDIENAYGGLAGWNAAMPAHNPAANAASFVGMPITMYYSTNDPIALPSIAETFAAATGATLISMGALGHGSGPPYTSAAQAAFLGRYA